MLLFEGSSSAVVPGREKVGLRSGYRGVLDSLVIYSGRGGRINEEGIVKEEWTEGQWPSWLPLVGWFAQIQEAGAW